VAITAPVNREILPTMTRANKAARTAAPASKVDRMADPAKVIRMGALANRAARMAAPVSKVDRMADPAKVIRMGAPANRVAAEMTRTVPAKLAAATNMARPTLEGMAGEQLAPVTAMALGAEKAVAAAAMAQAIRVVTRTAKATTRTAPAIKVVAAMVPAIKVATPMVLVLPTTAVCSRVANRANRASRVMEVAASKDMEVVGTKAVARDMEVVDKVTTTIRLSTRVSIFEICRNRITSSYIKSIV